MSGNDGMLQAKRDLFRKLKGVIRSKAVLDAMESVPRERFVGENSRQMAYQNIPLPIGEGQTISQPLIVALMTEALELRGTERVLEIGAGSGYQAAVLSRLLPRGSLVTVERLSSLAEDARLVLGELDCSNVIVELAGPTLGAPEHGPFDAIIVTAASPQIPDALVAQLVVGGRMIIPVGRLEQQELMWVLRTDEGVSLRWLGPCRFVPLIGEEAFPEN
ncbi:MAG: protein-L-isoaspartate(D-aspartate) O-methyltransferase [Chloroflexi bacterium]|nr:protein-L-isoaspartate(D-aspartate) O-methyltransferase [Chloroflexota bacterium]